jgi:hypothetical protein
MKNKGKGKGEDVDLKSVALEAVEDFGKSIGKKSKLARHVPMLRDVYRMIQQGQDVLGQLTRIQMATGDSTSAMIQGLIELELEGRQRAAKPAAAPVPKPIQKAPPTPKAPCCNGKHGDSGARMGAAVVVPEPETVPTLTFRNDRSGETVRLNMTRQQILTRYLETAQEGNWLWFWLAKHCQREQRQPAQPERANMIAFLSDSFLLALGMGLKRPMIRLWWRDRRYKIYLSRRGSLCFKTGAVVPGTSDPTGDEEYAGCLARGRFIISDRRNLLPEDQEVLERLGTDPAGFLAEASRGMCRCCYCGLPLEDARSKKVGYGPICAAHWGLPWGDKSVMDAVPSFAQMWRESDPEAKRNVRVVCQAIRKTSRDSSDWLPLWEMLGDLMEEVGYAKKPEPPASGVIIPNAD